MSWKVKGAAMVAMAGDQVMLVEELETRPDVWKKSGMLSVPMGEIRPGETAIQTACREFREEIGFAVEPLFPIGFFEIDMQDFERVAIWAFAGELGDRLAKRESDDVRPRPMVIRDIMSLDPKVFRPRVIEILSTYFGLHLVGSKLGLEFVKTVVPSLAVAKARTWLTL